MAREVKKTIKYIKYAFGLLIFSTFFGNLINKKETITQDFIPIEKVYADVPSGGDGVGDGCGDDGSGCDDGSSCE